MAPIHCQVSLNDSTHPLPSILKSWHPSIAKYPYIVAPIHCQVNAYVLRACAVLEKASDTRPQGETSKSQAAQQAEGRRPGRRRGRPG
ncbi:hypothetical protein CEXT_577441 [Caerostris extrusa]|uniref:Uncharacterized protein n=1 Tax=Caerostris extrusa TaxID=172846 RepID=A0AAV4RKS6_CAEEX|nr:hypothetical protein CEXT_577441 [Caerostris extrusa]